MHIARDSVVTIEYTMRTEEGEVIDSSDHGDPMSFIQGAGTVFPALEEQLEGRNSGEHLAIRLTATQAYGDRDERLVKTVPRSHFKFSETLRPGMHFKTMRDDTEVDVTVVEVNEESVIVDANSPLAGVPITLDIVITDVRLALPEELASGQVQMMDDIYAHEMGR